MLTVNHKPSTVVIREEEAVMTSFPNRKPPLLRKDSSSLSKRTAVAAIFNDSDDSVRLNGSLSKNMQDESLSSLKSSADTVVSFDLVNNQYHHVQNTRSMPLRMKKALWYSKPEYKEIEAENEATLALMVEGNKDPEQIGYCYRGLECMMESIAERQYDNVYAAYDAVFAAQDELRQKGINNPQLIAQIYQEVSKKTKSDALKMGQWDARNVKALWRRPSKDVAPTLPRRKWAKAG